MQIVESRDATHKELVRWTRGAFMIILSNGSHCSTKNIARQKGWWIYPPFLSQPISIQWVASAYGLDQVVEQEGNQRYL